MVFQRLLRPLVAIAALAGLGSYAVIMLRGPQGLSALTAKHHEIQALEEENANLERDIQAKKTRIDRLQHDPNMQELEIRKRTKMQRQGETKFVLPDAPNAAPRDHSSPQ